MISAAQNSLLINRRSLDAALEMKKKSEHLLQDFPEELVRPEKNEQSFRGNQD